jgi:NAD(P)-dependent dehydrogenase (short-subunit alcohol dehydrogenase family)
MNLVKSENTTAYNFMKLNELYSHPLEIDWLIEDLIPNSSVGMIYGASGSGKSHIILSMAAMVAFPQLLAYCGSKGAVRMMTKAVAIEYANEGIRVNCFCPGSIMTGMLEGMPDDYVDAVIQANPVKRVGEPHEIADLALFLASDESKFITGTEIVIDGGYTAL